MSSTLSPAVQGRGPGSLRKHACHLHVAHASIRRAFASASSIEQLGRHCVPSSYCILCGAGLPQPHSLPTCVNTTAEHRAMWPLPSHLTSPQPATVTGLLSFPPCGSDPQPGLFYTPCPPSLKHRSHHLLQGSDISIHPTKATLALVIPRSGTPLRMARGTARPAHPGENECRRRSPC